MSYDELDERMGARPCAPTDAPTDDPRDEPLDETLMAHARDYNTPGDVPREAMWKAIAGRTGRTGRAGRAGEARVLPFRRAVRVMLPIAAVLVAGILIGRLSRAGDEGRGTRDRARESSNVISNPQGDRSNSLAQAMNSGNPIASSSLGQPAGRPYGSPRNDGATGDSRPSSLVPRPSSEASAQSVDLFSVAAERHFAQAESFLTLCRASVREGKSESLAPGTARELLVSNRLLMDSPAANDPKVRHLLDDIELVLAQIAQMPAEGRQADARIITDGLEAGGVLTRIRSEVTSGPVAAVPQGAL
jgi:hypothetical protein